MGYIKLKRVVFKYVILIVSIYTSKTFAQNYVVSGSEMVITGNIDFTSSVSWETNKSVVPGFYTWINNAENYSGASDSNHINGYVKKIGSQEFTFPVGSGSDLRTLQLSAPASNTSEYAVAWLEGNPDTTPDPTNANQLHATTSVSGTIKAVSPVGHWDWLPLDGTGEGLTVTVSIPALSGDMFTNAADVRLVGWNGSSWVNLGTSGASGLTENSTLSGTMIAGIQAVGIGVVSNVLAQIGNEGDSPNTVISVVTVAQINTISPDIIGAIVANEVAYQVYIDANPGLFSSPATAAEVQAMINTVNASQSVLAQIGNEGDSPNTISSVVTVAQINTISPAIIGAIVANEASYQAYIDANPGLFSLPATAAEVQAMITTVNDSQSVLAQIGNEGDNPNTVPSVVTVAQINTILPAIIGAIVANEAAYQAYIDANPGLFSSPATAAEVQAMINAVNALVVRVIAAPVFTVVQNADGTLTVNGTAEKDGTVTITFPDGSTQLVTVNSQGTFGPITSLLPQALKGEVKAVVVSASGVSSVPATVPYETIKNVSVSEAFTPNGDGINDTWQILDLDKFPNTTVRVYNRWGHLVFSSKNYQNDWAGNYNDFNSILPESSSYYYQIDYGSDGSVDKEGWLYIRK